SHRKWPRALRLCPRRLPVDRATGLSRKHRGRDEELYGRGQSDRAQWLHTEGGHQGLPRSLSGAEGPAVMGPDPDAAQLDRGQKEGSGMTDFDIEKFRLTPERRRLLKEAEAIPSKRLVTKTDRWHAGFIKVPAWVLYKHHFQWASTWPLYLYILRRSFQRSGPPFALTNAALAELGISRWRKDRALRELEKLGLVRGERS